MNSMTLGLVIGNRGFFPDHLCESGRKTVMEVLTKTGIEIVVLSQEETKFGSVDSLEYARKCADLFKRHSDVIDGVLVALPNFGDERAIANTLRLSNLDVPVLVQAFPDDPTLMTIADR
jgi:L-fucose isomerase-like protein